MRKSNLENVAIPKLGLQQIPPPENRDGSHTHKDTPITHKSTFHDYNGYSERSAEYFMKTLDTQTKSNEIYHFSRQSTNRAAQ